MLPKIPFGWQSKFKLYFRRLSNKIKKNIGRLWDAIWKLMLLATWWFMCKFCGHWTLICIPILWLKFLKVGTTPAPLRKIRLFHCNMSLLIHVFIIYILFLNTDVGCFLKLFSLSLMDLYYCFWKSACVQKFGRWCVSKQTRGYILLFLEHCKINPFGACNYFLNRYEIQSKVVCYTRRVCASL